MVEPKEGSGTWRILEGWTRKEDLQPSEVLGEDAYSLSRPAAYSWLSARTMSTQMAAEDERPFLEEQVYCDGSCPTKSDVLYASRNS